MGLTYKDSGVDIDKGNNFVKRIVPFVRSTFSKEVITDIGGFSALYSAAFPGLEEPVLVSGTDGVGTKLKISQAMGKHDTVGIDLVAMCVNDILTSGARPLFFLDYIACGAIQEDVMVAIVKGIAEGCRQARCSLVGGETAEHPNVMDPHDYDLAGFAVGVVDRNKIINGSTIKKGDCIIGLASSGIHSNGYSMVRKLFFDLKKTPLDSRPADLGATLGEALLAPTKIYVTAIAALLEAGTAIKGLVHITGGGFYENIPRILPPTCGVHINKKSYTLPPIFSMMQREGNIDEREMYTTFNMGIGMMMFVDAADASAALEKLAAQGEHAWIIGEVVDSTGPRVVLA